VTKIHCAVVTVKNFTLYIHLISYTSVIALASTFTYTSLVLDCDTGIERSLQLFIITNIISAFVYLLSTHLAFVN